MTTISLLVFSGVSIFSITQVYGHGRLEDPPARSTAWRFGFNTPVNYNDNELFCGGFTNQWQHQGGKCGVCGDPYQGPRDHECPSGKYCSKTIVKTYTSGATITVKVHLTANHGGSFAFRVCPASDKKNAAEVTQECLNKHTMEVRNGKKLTKNDNYKYILPHYHTGIFDVKLKLPNGLTCDRCVLQWDYTTGNTWGQCPNGTQGVGCGPQETFRGCADVTIKK